jgi:predicted nucleotidyltransferase
MTREDAIGEVVWRLVDHYSHERIYLFGSSARGDAKPSSDLDFLVVLPDAVPREKLFDGTVYQKLWGIPLAVDVIPYRHTAFEARSNWLMSLPAIALREGRLTYDAALVPASGIA